MNSLIKRRKEKRSPSNKTPTTSSSSSPEMGEEIDITQLFSLVCPLQINSNAPITENENMFYIPTINHCRTPSSATSASVTSDYLSSPDSFMTDRTRSLDRHNSLTRSNSFTTRSKKSPFIQHLQQDERLKLIADIGKLG